MYLKNSEIYLIVGTLSIIVVFLAFCPIQLVTINNQTMFNTFFNLKFEDGGVFAAIIVGIITVLVSGHYNNKNYKSMKLASIPTNSANLLIDLEYMFNEYEIYKQKYEKEYKELGFELPNKPYTDNYLPYKFAKALIRDGFIVCFEVKLNWYYADVESIIIQ